MSNWSSEVIEAKKISKGPIGVGTTSSSSVRLLGRRIENTFIITAFEPNKKLSSKTTSGPVEAIADLNFEPTEDGTKVTISVQAEMGDFFKLAKPIVTGLSRK